VDYSVLTEAGMRLDIVEAIAQVYLTDCVQYWLITLLGKLFFNSLLELFLADLQG
ncbi:radical SAM protein, partial [Salmonella enterica subsp. enterica serovar Typhimurium]